MTRKRTDQPKGFISVFVLVAMVGAVLIAAASLMKVSAQSRYSMGQLSPSQVDLLMEAGLELAKSRLASQPGYEGESWQIETGESGLRQTAKVEVKVNSDTDPNVRSLEVIVEFGDDPDVVIRDRRTWTISLPTSEQN